MTGVLEIEIGCLEVKVEFGRVKVGVLGSSLGFGVRFGILDVETGVVKFEIGTLEVQVGVLGFQSGVQGVEVGLLRVTIGILGSQLEFWARVWDFGGHG